MYAFDARYLKNNNFLKLSKVLVTTIILQYMKKNTREKTT